MQSEQYPPSCSGCFCVPDKGQACPSADMPQTSFRFTDKLRNMTWDNPVELNCNPYEEDNCTLTDSEGNAVGSEIVPSGAFCGVRFDGNINVNGELVSESGCVTSYSTKTFTTRQELESEGYNVTHLGGKSWIGAFIL